MGIKSSIIRPYGKRVIQSIKAWSENALDKQANLAKLLVDRAILTTYGRKHQFQSVLMHKDYRKQIPVMHEHDLSPHIEAYLQGGQSILWPGTPKYLMIDKPNGKIVRAISREASMEYYEANKKVLLYHGMKKVNTRVLDQKFLKLTGTIWSDRKANHTVSTLHSIINENLPSWLRPFQLPSKATNRILDASVKLSATVDEVYGQRIGTISASADKLMEFKQLLDDRHGRRRLSEHLTDLKIILLNIQSKDLPQASDFIRSIDNDNIQVAKVLSSQDGVMGFQDKLDRDDMLLFLDNGIFYEFMNDTIPDNERLWLKQVEIGEPYEILISNNSGLWSFKTGIWIEFTQKKPYRIKLLEA